MSLCSLLLQFCHLNTLGKIGKSLSLEIIIKTFFQLNKKFFALKKIVNWNTGYLSLDKFSFLIIKIRVKILSPDVW